MKKPLTSTVLAAALAVAGSAAFAENVKVKYGSNQCAADKKECVLFLRPMTDEELQEAGLSIDQLSNFNNLVDFENLDTVPAYTWFSVRG